MNELNGNTAEKVGDAIVKAGSTVKTAAVAIVGAVSAVAIMALKLISEDKK